MQLIMNDVGAAAGMFASSNLAGFEPGSQAWRAWILFQPRTGVQTRLRPPHL